MVKTRFANQDNEMIKHDHAVASLSEEMGLAPENIKSLYDRELHVLDETARVKDFLPILIGKKVKNILKN